MVDALVSPAQNMATTQLCRAIWRPAFSALCPRPHPSAPGPGVSILSRVGVEVSPRGPLTAGLWLLALILALNLVSRTQTPAGSLLCVQTWLRLGQDDGSRRTVDVSEWKLTAHLPGPTYAGPAAQHPALGWPGVEEGWLPSLGPGRALACLLAGGLRCLGCSGGHACQGEIIREGGFLEEGPMEPVASQRSWEPWACFLPLWASLLFPSPHRRVAWKVQG